VRLLKIPARSFRSQPDTEAAPGFPEGEPANLQPIKGRSDSRLRCLWQRDRGAPAQGRVQRAGSDRRKQKAATWGDTRDGWLLCCSRESAWRISGL